MKSSGLPVDLIALIIAIISLGLSGVSSYYQFGPRHEFRAYIADVVPSERGVVVVDLLLVNRGSKAETLIRAFVRDENLCGLGDATPRVVAPDSTVIVPLRIQLPPPEFRKSMIKDGWLPLNLGFGIVDERLWAKQSFVYSRFEGEKSLGAAFKVSVDARGRSTGHAVWSETSANLYDYWWRNGTGCIPVRHSPS